MIIKCEQIVSSLPPPTTSPSRESDPMLQPQLHLLNTEYAMTLNRILAQRVIINKELQARKTRVASLAPKYSFHHQQLDWVSLVRLCTSKTYSMKMDFPLRDNCGWMTFFVSQIVAKQSKVHCNHRWSTHCEEQYWVSKVKIYCACKESSCPLHPVMVPPCHE